MVATHVTSIASGEIYVVSISVSTHGICFVTPFKVSIKTLRKRLEQLIFKVQDPLLFKASWGVS